MTFSLDSDIGRRTGRISTDGVSRRRHDGIRRALGNGIRLYGTDGEIRVSREELTATGSLCKEKASDAGLNFDGHLGPNAMIDWSSSENGKPPKITGTNHRREFLERMRDRKDPICKIEVGAGTAAVCHLLNLAYWGNKPITWDAAK